MKHVLNWLRPSNDPRCNELIKPRPLDDRPLSAQRLVVVDLETSGLNLQRDHLLAIGAVVIEHGAIDFSQQFECTLCQPNHKASASTLIHGIAPSTIAAGREPTEALLEFMDFVGDRPLLAFHAPFDQHMLQRALKRLLGYRLQHPFIDVADLAPLLCPRGPQRRVGLDDWLDYFKLQAAERHNASADALATAELTLILFSQARRQGLDSLAELQRRAQSWRRRQTVPSL